MKQYWERRNSEKNISFEKAKIGFEKLWRECDEKNTIPADSDDSEDEHRMVRLGVGKELIKHESVSA